MKIESIALKHLLRCKKQFLILFTSIVLSMTMAVLLFVVVDKLKTEAGNSFDEIGANILVIPKISSRDLIYESVVAHNSNKEGVLSSRDYISINTIERRDNIATVAPKILQPVTAHNLDFILAGIYFQFEKEIKKWWEIEGVWPFRENEILLGNKIAKSLNKKTGDELLISGKIFLVTGVLSAQNTEEDEIVYANIMTVQNLFGQKDKISFIEVAAYCTTCPIEEIARQISEKIPNASVIIMAEAVKTREETIDKFASFSIVFTVVILLLGFVIVSLMMISNVNHRTREIGILRSIGYRKAHVADLILVEGAITGLLGGLAGYLLGMAGAVQTIKAIMPAASSIEWDMIPAVYAILISTLLGVISGVIPAVKAASMDPIESIKRI